MNLSYLVACGLMVTLLSVRIGAKPLSQAQQKVRGMHLYVTYPLIINALILLLYAVMNVEMCRFRAEQLMCTPKCFQLISPIYFFCLLKTAPIQLEIRTIAHLPQHLSAGVDKRR